MELEEGCREAGLNERKTRGEKRLQKKDKEIGLN